MEKRKNIFCAWVSGNKDSLNRGLLRNAFLQFGLVTKIFIDAEVTYAKVYLNDLDSLNLACVQLNGQNGWIVKAFRDNYNGTDSTSSPYEAPKNSSVSRSRSSLNKSFESASNGDVDEMDEECVLVGNYVDVRGRPVEVLQGENGALYVNLDDVRIGGYNIYKKEAFENASISEDIDLRHLENYLLNQGRKYVLETRRKFDEDEVLNVFERVRAKLENKPGGFADGRIINSARDSRNITISTPNTSASPLSLPGNRVPKELGPNFQPSFSHVKPRPKVDNRLDSRNDRQNGPATVFNGARRPQDNKYDNRSDTRKENWSDSRNGSRNEVPRQPLEPTVGSAEDGQSNARPRQNLENTKTKPIAHSSAQTEPEQSWEGVKASVPKSKPQSDTTSVGSQRRPINVERCKLAPNELYKIKVSYLKPDKKSLFYSQWVENLNEVDEILLHVNSVDLHLPEIVAPARDMLCVAYFEECWYRAVVLLEKSMDGGVFVELIDYGNKESITTPLREMSAEMKKIPGMAIRTAVHNKPGSDAKDLLFKTEQVLEVFVKKHYDDLTHLVEVKSVLDAPKMENESSSPPSELSSDHERSDKPAKAADKPVVSSTDKPGVSATDKPAVSSTDKPAVSATDKPAVSSTDKPVVSSTDKPGVSATDKPAVSSTDKPAVSATDKPAVSSTDKPVVSSTEDNFMEIPPSTAKLIKGESVMIVSYTSTKLILRNKETAMTCKGVYSHLATMEKKPITNPKVGQLVLCSSDGMDGMHRAVIKEINNQVAVLEYLDYYGEETLTLKSLRNVDKVLASYPIAKLESPVVEWLKTVTEKSEEYLTDLITNKTKLKVVLNGSQFDLILPGEEMLSKKIKKLESPPIETPKEPVAVSIPTKREEVTPPPPKKEQPPAKVEQPVVKAVLNDDKFVKVSYDAMPYAKAKIGKDTYSCYSCNAGSVTLLSVDAADYLERLLVIETEDTVPYEPEEFEMCLGKFEEIWYRAVLIKTNDTTSDVIFVDFGNPAEIPKSDIRKFPKEFAEIPILGMNAYFIGIPNNPKVYERLKELIPDETDLIIDVKEDLNDELKYGIEIPSIYEVLRKEKLV